MKRRNFIISASVVAVGVPAAFYLEKHYWKNNPLTTPDLMSRFCNEKEIKQIGIKYRSLVPVEDKKQKLTDLILTDSGGKKLATSDKIEIAKFIDTKIHEEFTGNNVIVVMGWVISITEARQCALFSLT